MARGPSWYQKSHAALPLRGVLLIGQLLRAVGHVEGRKKLQKMVHILQHFGAPFGFRSGYLHFGSYSSELQSQMEAFQEEGLINETPIEGLYKTSKFVANPELDELINRVLGDAQPEWSQLAIQLGKKSPSELEAISTIIFLREGGKNGEALRKSFRDLKPNLASSFDARLQEAETLESKFARLRSAVV